MKVYNGRCIFYLNYANVSMTCELGGLVLTSYI